MVDNLPHLLLSCGLSKYWGHSCQMMKIFKALDMVAIYALFAVCSILSIYLRIVISICFLSQPLPLLYRYFLSPRKV